MIIADKNFHIFYSDLSGKISNISVPTLFPLEIPMLPPNEAALSFMPINPKDIFELRSLSVIPAPLSVILR
jgi:hypothetical protein